MDNWHKLNKKRIDMQTLSYVYIYLKIYIYYNIYFKVS